MRDWVRQISGAQAGEHDAFGEIVREFEGMAVGYAYSILGDFQSAEDAAQEAFIQCYLSLPQLRSPQAFPAWFKQIVFRQCSRMTRNRRFSTASLDKAGEVTDREQDPAQMIQKQQVNAAIQSLPEHERDVTALFYMSGYSMGEVAAFLDLPVTTVKNRLHSARTRLREAMTGMVEETLKRHKPGDDFRKRLEEKLRWSRMWITDVGCIKGCLDYLDRDVSIPWLMGGTGHAFVINIAPSVCPSAPSSWDKKRFYELGKNVGFEVDTVFAHRLQGDFDRKKKTAWNKVRKALDQGFPCYGWNLQGPIYSVIHGYDDLGYLFRLPDMGDGHMPWRELGETEIGLLQVWVMSPVEPADDEKTVRDAFEYALVLGEGGDDPVGPPSKLGMPGYELWLHEINTGQAGGFGMAYNAACWAQCRYFAKAFLGEAKERLGGHGTRWDEAIGHYGRVFENLAKLNAIYPFDPAWSTGFDYDMSEGARRLATGHIREAMEAETAGLETIRELLRRL